MTRPPLRRGAALLAAATALALTAGVPSALAATAGAPLPPGTRFFVPLAPAGSRAQIDLLTRQGHERDRDLVRAEVTTPQAVWFTSGTPHEVHESVEATVRSAARRRTVPTLVAYDVPGRDCSQYSSGGAGSDTAYRAWADGFAAGLTRGQRVVVVVEPDGLANLPSDCPAAYPGQDVAALTAGRIADIHYLGAAVEKADPAALVYLDAGHSAWHSVADTTTRLEQAGVRDFQGFSLNVSNYQYSSNLAQYGTWVSSCIALHPDAATTTPKDCGDQYYSGGPLDGFASGGALDPGKQWSDTATDPTASTANINARYAQELAAAEAAPTTHFVVDTSRNGRGPWTPAAGTSYPDPQTWCNPPGRGLGARPQASPDARFPLLDADLWIKTPGQSDGQCNRGVAGSTTDPEWGGITDPAAGAWFPQQALQLARLAVPPLHR